MNVFHAKIVAIVAMLQLCWSSRVRRHAGGAGAALGHRLKNCPTSTPPSFEPGKLVPSDIGSSTMQSGITASEELQQAFSDLLSNTSLRGLLAGIKDEKLVPIQPIISTFPDFESDLSTLDKLLKDNEAAYVILRRYDDGLNPFALVTYVPDSAHVRQKMLVASTRLTLLRELGTEKFRETLFATTKQELTADGFRKHDEHVELYV